MAINRNDFALLSIVRLDDLHERYKSGHRFGQRAFGFGYQCGIDQSDYSVVACGHVLLRRVRGKRHRRDQYQQQLLGWGARYD